jgi:hypothetical protein
MCTAEQMDMILVRTNRFYLDRKSFRNLDRRLLRVRHTSEGTRKDYPRKKLRGITGSNRVALIWPPNFHEFAFLIVI